MNLYHEQGIYILSLLWYEPNPDDNTGKLICLSLETLQLKLGLNRHLLSHDWNALHPLATPTWLSHTWRFMAKYNIQIETHTPEIPLLWEGDQLLMAVFFQAGICGKELTTLNWCQIFLQVAMLANILDGSRFYISDPMLAGQPNTTFTSRFTWPNQGQPTKKEWAQ